MRPQRQSRQLRQSVAADPWCLWQSPHPPSSLNPTTTTQSPPAQAQVNHFPTRLASTSATTSRESAWSSVLQMYGVLRLDSRRTTNLKAHSLLGPSRQGWCQEKSPTYPSTRYRTTTAATTMTEVNDLSQAARQLPPLPCHHRLWRSGTSLVSGRPLLVIPARLTRVAATATTTTTTACRLPLPPMTSDARQDLRRPEWRPTTSSGILAVPRVPPWDHLRTSQWQARAGAPRPFRLFLPEKARPYLRLRRSTSRRRTSTSLESSWKTASVDRCSSTRPGS